MSETGSAQGSVTDALAQQAHDEMPQHHQNCTSRDESGQESRRVLVFLVYYYYYQLIGFIERYSLLSSTHCAIVACDSEWMTVAYLTPFLFVIFLFELWERHRDAQAKSFVRANRSRYSGGHNYVYHTHTRARARAHTHTHTHTALFGCYIVGATRNCYSLSARSVYTMHLFTVSLLSEQRT